MSKAKPVTVYFSATKEDMDLLEIINQYPRGQASYMIKYLARIGAASLMATGQLDPPPTTPPISKTTRNRKPTTPKSDISQSQNLAPPDSTPTPTPTQNPIPTSVPSVPIITQAKNNNVGDPFNPPMNEEELEEYRQLTNSTTKD